MRRRRLILALAPVLALATAALAQPGGHEVRIHRGGPPSEETKARHEAMKKQHLDDLKTVLRLRPDQEAALAAFTAAHEPQRFEIKLDGKDLTTPQRLEQMAKHEDAMRAARQKHREALTRFYAALSPDQQKVFDALHRLKGHGGGHGRPGRRVMMLGGGPGMMMHGDHDVVIRREIRPGGPHDD